MFSGIIKEIKKARTFNKSESSMEISFEIPEKWKLELGESINIDGICSTVKSLDSKIFSVYYMPETLSKTSLATLSENHIFNLERCIALNTLISGHLVYGHVDTAAEVSKVEKDEKSVVIEFKIDPNCTKYMVYKGSVAVNGVSLTVVSVEKNIFTVSLIPHTLANTNLGYLTVGNKVNVEVDMIAKHVEKLLKR